ncbi:BTAD domain-containing putative transcriptional regulator [Microtetraspora sp. NBRC 16547]|uniref:AfsR/SARP family transcriptional regulator n=1 Tax=Microtetraspora sp. NBRC 16547 TaxID=3030993 RepID=UPI0024A34FBC|nr:BTAD domain-containing putative transcriptional regulator [Microtetraspora sp. NBRC 16547]GLW96562.1 AfsR family transcriptional regulator [Microtetraspora sp. NBRC 16547]
MEGTERDAGLRFAVLGPLEVRQDGRQIEIGGQRLRALLTTLLLSAGGVVPVDALVAGVWENNPPSGVGNALQALVSRLRAAIDREVVVAHPSGYRLAVSPDLVDVHLFTRLCRDGGRALAERDAAGAARTLRDALALWRGPALPDLPDGAPEVARLEDLRIAATEDRIDADLMLERHAEVLPELRALIADHPLRERLRGQFMRALYSSGRQVEALAAYEEARSAFADLLGADPSPRLAELHLAMLRRGPLPFDGATAPASSERPSPESPSPSPSQSPSLSAPGPVPGARKGNLRARLTSFVGRETDVERAGDLLDTHRLVTLLGSGGAGKTRLAVETAEVLSARVPDGAWLVELASLRDPAEIAQTMLTSLGLRDASLMTRRPGTAPHAETDPVERLTGLLAGRRMLIVLDNCEHLIEPAAVLVDRLLADCPDVRVLATSREPLGITGEMLWPVRPLGLDHAVRLFADRAAAARSGYAVDGERPAVERICRELDGMPLAIELAAARLRTLSAMQIADRLDDRFRLLTSGSRTALPRHQTLRAVVEWSWELLDDDERRLAARLSVFAGGATLEGAERVCAATGMSGWAVDLLGHLVDKSLVVYDDGRYLMLETIRAYAAERLAESGEEQRVRLAHATFFTDLAETADARLRGRDQVEWLERLSAEQDNLSAALRWAVDGGHADLAIRLVGALGWYWWLAGRRAEGEARAVEVIRIVPEDTDPAKRALLFAVYGMTALGGSADVERAREALEEVGTLAGFLVPGPRHPIVALARPVLSLFLRQADTMDELLAELFADADPWVVASAHLFRGNLHFNSGRVANGEADTLAALDGFRVTGDRWGIANSLAALAEVSAMRGNNAAAIPVMREAIAFAEEIDASDDTPYMRSRLAQALNAAGDRAGALAVLGEAERICTEGDDPVGVAGVHVVRGEFAREDGDLELARRNYAEAVRLIDGPGAYPPQFRAIVSAALGLLAEQEGDAVRSRRMNAEALEAAVASEDGPIIGHVLIARAGLAVLDGEPELAARLLGAAAAMRGMEEVAAFDHARITANAQAALGPEEFSRAYERGRAMPFAEMVAAASG